MQVLLHVPCRSLVSSGLPDPGDPKPQTLGKCGVCGVPCPLGVNKSRNTVTNVQIPQVTEKRVSLLSGPSFS